jgi:hypothetical protein
MTNAPKGGGAPVREPSVSLPPVVVRVMVEITRPVEVWGSDSHRLETVRVALNGNKILVEGEWTLEDLNRATTALGMSARRIEKGL